MRELENVLRLAFIRGPDGAEIAPEHLMAPTGRVSVEPEPVSLQELEKRAIQRAMDQAEGTMAAAARVPRGDRHHTWLQMEV